MTKRSWRIVAALLIVLGLSNCTLQETDGPPAPFPGETPTAATPAAGAFSMEALKDVAVQAGEAAFAAAAATPQGQAAIQVTEVINSLLILFGVGGLGVGGTLLGWIRTRRAKNSEKLWIEGKVASDRKLDSLTHVAGMIIGSLETMRNDKTIRAMHKKNMQDAIAKSAVPEEIVRTIIGRIKHSLATATELKSGEIALPYYEDAT